MLCTRCKGAWHHYSQPCPDNAMDRWEAAERLVQLMRRDIRGGLRRTARDWAMETYRKDPAAARVFLAVVTSEGTLDEAWALLQNAVPMTVVENHPRRLTQGGIGFSSLGET